MTHRTSRATFPGPDRYFASPTDRPRCSQWPCPHARRGRSGAPGPGGPVSLVAQRRGRSLRPWARKWSREVLQPLPPREARDGLLVLFDVPDNRPSSLGWRHVRPVPDGLPVVDPSMSPPLVRRRGKRGDRRVVGDLRVRSSRVVLKLRNGSEREVDPLFFMPVPSVQIRCNAPMVVGEIRQKLGGCVGLSG